MIPGELADVDGDAIQRLVENGVPEGPTLDFKEALPPDNDEGRREFLADVSAFANTIGGDLVYGISEQRDALGKLTGVPEAVVGVTNVSDSLLVGLQSRIRDGIEPRLSGVEVRAVACAERQVLVVRVAQSWVMPHMVTFKNLSRFFARSGASKYQMNVDDLRQAFTRADTLRARTVQFRNERIARLVDDRLLVSPPWLALHVVPAASMVGRQLDREKLTSFMGKILPMRGGGSWTWNLDGPIIHAGPPPMLLHGYAQIFRDGAIESVAGGIADAAEPILPLDAIEVWTISALGQYLRASAGAQLSPPFWVMLTLVGVKGYYGPGNVRQPRPIDRDVVVLPEALLLDRQIDDTQVRLLFDAMWQAAGIDGSPNFEEGGKWCRPR